ncbi:MAG: hypothetical protein JST04_06705 [Bdellovibrionales bacterium]|nr:hypothetical protein [Bdellovibrionales bacterium]
MSAPTYLAKAGKVTGPFDAKTIEEMKASGEFYKHEWMWDGQSPDWSPVPRQLASPPSLPEVPKQITRISVDQTATHDVKSSAAKAPAPAAVQAKSSFGGADIKTSKKTFCAVLFDTRLTIGGEVSQAHSRGGRFVSTPTHSVPVSKGSNALLDLLDEATDRSTKIQASVTNVSRMGDRWVLDLEWSSLPLLDA